MKNENYQRKSKQNLQFPRTVRNPYEALNTSCRAGKTMPGGFIYLMPEDAIGSGSRVNVMVQMEETEKMLSNAVRVTAHAHFVSFAALDRFDGLDAVHFAWAQRAGAENIVETHTADAAIAAFHAHYGEHIPVGDDIWQLPIEAYNTVVNHRRALVSKSLPERTALASTLARCLWGQTALARVVPDWDAGLLEASAELEFGGANLPVAGTGIRRIGTATTSGRSGLEVNTSTDTVTITDDAGNDDRGIEFDIGVAGQLENMYAELAGGAGTVSLAAIENAKRTKAFAEIRATMAGTDEDLINLFMRGFSIPNAMYYDPILIGSASSTIGQMQRYATDSANLDNYVANGMGALSLPLNLPQQSTGGVVVITYEITPEPVFDRMAPSILYKAFDDLPNALRDYLDTQPVQVVPNRFVDNLHTTPDGTFGYAPMNHDWSTRRIKMGGRYLRTLAADASDEDQQHVWSVREVDPVLDEDTFLVPADLDHNVFLDTVADPFIVRVEWSAAIQGITQFGPALYESTGDYAAVASEIPESNLIPPSEVV